MSQQLTPSQLKAIQKLPLEYELGAGGFGQVFKVIYKGKTYAIKRLEIYDSNDPSERASLLKEVAIHKKLSLNPTTHEDVPIFYGSYKKGNYYYIVMEYLKGMDLAEYCKSSKIPKKAIEFILSEIKEILEEFHSLGIVFNDLYANNIYLQLKKDGTFKVKLIDFGQAAKEGDVTEAETGNVAKKSNNWEQYERLTKTLVRCEQNNANRNNKTKRRNNKNRSNYTIRNLLAQSK